MAVPFNRTGGRTSNILGTLGPLLDGFLSLLLPSANGIQVAMSLTTALGKSNASTVRSIVNAANRLRRLADPDEFFPTPGMREPRAVSRVGSLWLKERSLMVAAVALTLVAVGDAQVASVSIATEAPAGLEETATKLRAALIFTLPLASDKVIPQVGFFIDGNGLALCPLEPLHAKAAPVFRTGEGQQGVLKKPVVLKVFPDQRLALVKFDYTSTASLPIAKEPAAVGTWVAVVPSAFTDRNSIAGPIVAHRLTQNVSQTKPLRPPQKQYSIALGANPSYAQLLLPGAPIVNSRGEVVATFAGSQAMPGQILRLAYPLAGFPAQIDAAVKKGNRRPLPLGVEEMGLDPATLSDECHLMGASAITGDLAKARQLAHKLVEKFPDSLSARCDEFGYATQEALSGQGQPDELVGLAKRSQPLEPATPLDQAAYQERLGQALIQAGRVNEAMDALRKSHELDSRALACMTLATIHERRGELEQAEECWRQTATFDTDRIEYWDRYQRVLTARGKSKEAAAAQDRVFLLEDLYRSR